MIQLLEKPKSLRVLHLEDDRSSQVYFDHIIKAKLDKVKIKNVDDCLSFYCQLPFEKPHILVIDWVLKNFDATYILDALNNFKGEVIFLSSMSKNYIREEVTKRLGRFPSNFKVFTKGDVDCYENIISELSKYAKKNGMITA
jgi:hypothetical protein